MRSVWQVLAALLATGAIVAHADSRHDALDPTKHPPEHFYVNGKRPPGSLILTMLTKDEAENLNVTLPKWAKVIDYWVIGIDEENTDNSPEVIMQHVGHIPGEIVTVHFDGMGPTWTKLTDKGWELFPEGTHGIVADADYVPTDRMIENFDKHDLHIGANKLLYKLWNDPNAVSDVRKMDWIYRNMPGVKVTRRVHQTVTTPPFHASDSIRVEEAHSIDILELGGGYQLRTMSSRGRNLRYIKLLELDLLDIPNDPRTLYYLADSHRGVFMAGYSENNVTKSDWDHLDKSIAYYKKRLEVPSSRNNFEETYFTMIAVAELSERFLHDYDEGFKYYQKAFDFDPERADPQFYIGQRKRLRGDLRGAIKPLLTAARMHPPVRSVFQWVAMYDCIATVELARAVHGLLVSEGYSDALTYSTVKETHNLLKTKANSNKGCEFHRETDYARDGLRLASALGDFVRQGPPAGGDGGSQAANKPRAGARKTKKYGKPGAGKRSAQREQPTAVELSPLANTQRPRGGRYFDSDKYGTLTRFEPAGGRWAFQHPMAEADMGLGYSTQQKRALGVHGADKARVTAESFSQHMSLLNSDGDSFTVGTGQWNHGAGKQRSKATSMPSTADRARTGTRRLSADSRAQLRKLADTLEGWISSAADSQVLQDSYALHPAPPQTFLPTSPLSPSYNPRSDNRGRNVEGTSAAPGFQGEGALMVYKPGEAPAGDAAAEGAPASPAKRRKRRRGGPRSASAAASANEPAFAKVPNPLAPRPEEPMRDFMRRSAPGGVVPGNTRLRSQASAARHNPVPESELRSFWSNEFGNVALSALERSATRLRFLRQVVDSPSRAVSCADFRQQVRLLERMVSSDGFEGALPQLGGGGALQAQLEAARGDACFSISA